MSVVEQRDFILLAMGTSFSLHQDHWQQVARQLESRLGVTASSCTENEWSSQSFWTDLWGTLARGHHTRLLVVTLDNRSAVLQSLRDALAWQSSAHGQPSPNPHLRVQFSSAWDEVDWAEVLAGSPLAYSHAWRVTTQLHESITPSEYTTQRHLISGLIWEMRRLGLDADFILLDNRYEPTYPHGPSIKLNWTFQATTPFQNGINSSDLDLELVESGTSRLVPWTEVVPTDAWVHVMVSKYLKGIKFCIPQSSLLENVETLRFDRNGPKGNDYDDLLFRMEELLPSEYRGKWDTVSPNSMGSAKIEVEADGKIAWDKIWTSFCDLALAGGPPHRGKLLEAVTSEECKSDLERYESVVTEIERGVQLVTGLATVRSEVLGWVGVECDDEKMAAWLMRAIVVENVMVRRQGRVLYLPAGPNFQLTKEIKNVITSVAKTVHYWRDH